MDSIEEIHPAEAIARKLTDLRISRLNYIAETFTSGDPNIVNNVIADMMNLLENLFVVLNMPSDGFVPLMPEQQYGEQQPE